MTDKYTSNKEVLATCSSKLSSLFILVTVSAVKPNNPAFQSQCYWSLPGSTFQEKHQNDKYFREGLSAGFQRNIRLRNTNGSHTNWPEYCHLAVCLNALKITHSILEYCHKLTKHWKVKNTVIRRKQTTFCFRNSKYVAKLEMSSNWVFRTTLCPIFCLILEFEQFKASAHYD